MTERSLLIVGARPGSLGDYCRKLIVDTQEMPFVRVMTAGISGENIRYDASNDQIPSGFTDVICTVGMNLPSVPMDFEFISSMEKQMETNFFAVMKCLNSWHIDWSMRASIMEDVRPVNFVAISSNSAHIARSNSVGYCASKAALSMGIRSFARSIRAQDHMNVWGYEPGWINGTPMSREASERFSGPAHRMLKEDGLMAPQLSALVLADVLSRGRMLHGSMVRVDCGEQ